MPLTSTTSASPAQYQPSILLAEDDDAFRSLLAAELRADGYRVVDVRNGSHALQHLVGSRPARSGFRHLDLVVTDINLPGGLSGLDLASVIRHDNIPARLVCLTAFASSEVRERARLLGADAFFDKPFDIDAFRCEIAALLGRSCPKARLC